MGTTETKEKSMEKEIVELAERVSATQKSIEIPQFMDRGKKSSNSVSSYNELKFIKVNMPSQNKWDLLRKLDELVGLIVSGEEPRSGEIRYILNQKDSYRSEKIRGTIKVK